MVLSITLGFCGVPLCKHLPNKSNKSVIVHVDEAFRPKDQPLPSILKEKSLRSDLRLNFDQKHPYTVHLTLILMYFVGHMHHSIILLVLGSGCVSWKPSTFYFLLIPMWIPRRDPEPDKYHLSCMFCTRAL